MSAIQIPSGFNGRRLRSNLLRSEAAMLELARLGIDRGFVERAGLGIKEPYVAASGEETSSVVTYPLRFDGDRCRYGYMALNGVTIRPDHPVAWSPGEPRALLLGEAGDLLVVASPLSAFQARACLDRLSFSAAVTASSQPDRVPADWNDPAFWAPWTRIVVSGQLPLSIRRQLLDVVGRPIELSAGAAPAVLDEDVDIDWVAAMLGATAPLTAAGLDLLTKPDAGPGDFEAKPISLHGGVAAGRMYFPFVIERRQAAASGDALLCRYETVVLRSDGAVLEGRTLPAPAGTPAHLRVHALSDGTRITSPPVASRNSTWSLPAIRDFVSRRAAAVDPCRRSTSAIFSDVVEHLTSRVRLMERDDYFVLASFVVMTHMFRAFDALPLLVLRGAKGTGKTEIAAAVASLSFNATVMGQGSAAALVRMASECGGLVVLDDVEGLGVGGAGFGELSQCLKVGYRASTSVKPITLGSGRVETFDFFGPRLLTSTRGVEPILASRCIEVATGEPGLSEATGTSVDSAGLRDELHALGMSRVVDVAARYAECAGDRRCREDEIWSPLEIIATKLGDAEAIAALGRAKASRSG